MHKKSKISFKAINKLAIPAIISGIAEPLLSITDTAIVGNIQNHPTEALAAVGIAGSFISALVWILAQTRSAISATVGKYLGAKKLPEINSLPAQIIAFNMVVSILIYAITLFFAEEIFRLYNANGLILNYSVSYFKIRAIGFPLTLFVFSVFGIFGGLQNTFWPMVISMIGAALNIGLDFLLVYGVEGILEPMNIEGAAWASVISQAVMAILALILLLKKTPFKLKINFPLNKEMKKLLAISLNLAIRAAALNVALYLANAYATKYGSNYIAAQTIAFQIWLFFAFFIDGYSSVGNIVSGKLLGEQNYKKLWKLSIKLSKYGISIAFMLLIVCAIFYFPIGKLFSKDEQVLQAFYSVFWIVLIMQPINAIAFIFDGIFKGLAEAATLRNLLIVATFFVFTPILLIGDFFNLKLYGIWLAFTVWMLVRAGVLVIKFRRKYLHKNM
jgi:putative MATE family efflux protein